MKFIFALLPVLISFNCFSQTLKKADTLQNAKANPASALQFNGVAVLSRVGFSPVPSFSFNNPIAMVFLSLSKGNFSYEPAVNLGLNGKPWFIDNWVKYRFLNGSKLKLTAGVDPNMIFQNEILPGKQQMLQGCRQVITALFADYTLSKNLSFKFTYWYDEGIDKGTLTGHFIDITGTVSNIKPSKKTFIKLTPEVFWFKNDGRVDGLFTSATVIASQNKYPLSLYVQAVQRLWADFNTVSFNWNAGLTYVF
jgi:hypothetical protein